MKVLTYIHLCFVFGLRAVLALGFVLFLASGVCAEELKTRTWQLSEGVSFEAEYTGITKQIVLLRLTNGTQKAVWFAKLGAEDQRYVIERLNEDERKALGDLAQPPPDPAAERRNQMIRRLDALRAAGQITDAEYSETLSKMRAQPAP